MNASQFKKLIVLLLFVVGIGCFLLLKDGRDWSQSESNLGGKVIPDFPLNKVASVILQDGEEEINLIKKDGIWTVSERWHYPADYSKVHKLIRDVWDLKAIRNISAGQSHYGRLGLLPPGEGEDSGMLLTFKEEDGSKIATLLLGKEHMKKYDARFSGEFADGRYVLPNDKGEAIALVSETFSSLDLDNKNWIDQSFIKVEKIQSVSITHPEQSDSWSISRESESADMVLDDRGEDEELNPSMSYLFKNMLSSPSFDDIVDPSFTEKEQESPTLARLQTFDGFTYEIKIVKAVDENIDENEDENFDEIEDENFDENVDDYWFSIQVSADILSEREKSEDEKEEDMEQLDAEFEANKKRLEEKFAKEKGYENWTYLVSGWNLKPLLDKRSELMNPKEEEVESSVEPPDPNAEINESADDVEAIIDALVNPLPAIEE